MTVLHNTASFEAKKSILRHFDARKQSIPTRDNMLQKKRIRSFFVEKKEPKKATVKRCTPRLIDTSLFNDSTTVASAVGIRFYFIGMTLLSV